MEDKGHNSNGIIPADGVDYQELYVDYENQEFIDSLEISESAENVLKLLYSHRDTLNYVIVPDFCVEGLVHSKNTPYQALKDMHYLRDMRIVDYDTTLRDYGYFAQRTVGADGELTPRELDEHIRIAIFNLEYPVMYYCHKEDGIIDDLGEAYSAIRGNELSEYLVMSGKAVMLEFLNYVKGTFNIPVIKGDSDGEKEKEAGDGDEDIPSSRRLAQRIWYNGDSGEIWEGSERGIPVEADGRVEGSSGGKDASEEEIVGADFGDTDGEARAAVGSAVGDIGETE